MRDRDQLIELIQDAVDGCSSYWAGLIADNLIAHGVTVQQWIPVSERLPDRHALVLTVIDHVGGGRIWARTVGFCEYNAQTMTFDADIGEIVTHWMPLPEAPKEVE